MIILEKHVILNDEEAIHRYIVWAKDSPYIHSLRVISVKESLEIGKVFLHNIS